MKNSKKLKRQDLKLGKALFIDESSSKSSSQYNTISSASNKLDKKYESDRNNIENVRRPKALISKTHLKLVNSPERSIEFEIGEQQVEVQNFKLENFP